jgi:hypothetical protein
LSASACAFDFERAHLRRGLARTPIDAVLICP